MKLSRWLVWAAPLVLVGAAQGSVVAIGDDSADSTEHLGKYWGTLDYVAMSPTAATLTLTLSNTSAAANSGFITGIAFQNPGDHITGVSLATTTHLSTLLGGSSFHDGIAAQPFGNFDIGASLNGNFNGSGNPNSGLAAGQTGTWTFSLSGTGLQTLSASSFMQMSESCDEDATPFLARFRGFSDGGSDKVPGMLVAIPEASSFLLVGATGSLALWLGWRGRRAAAG